ncbi:MAG TPA: RNA-binding cell elongation regulator Jag/EloR [Bacillus sp. (in: firmicutes)]|nr:RNA-binding cell elongation regulator Jag/EloR [Bacillus sp. (in: firmicutes)]
MNKVTAEGQNVEEAVKSGLNALGISREQAIVRIVDEGKRGFLGLWKSRPAVVEIEKVIDPVEEAAHFLKAVASEMGVHVHMEISQTGKQHHFHLSGDNMGILIGKRGQTINALQLLTQLVANRYSNQYLTITLDPEGYKERRKETLENLAKKLAIQVSKTSEKVVLEPMPSYERKIIHQTLKNHPLVKTSSIGEGPKRKVVLEPIIR